MENKYKVGEIAQKIRLRITSEDLFYNIFRPVFIPNEEVIEKYATEYEKSLIKSL